MINDNAGFTRLGTPKYINATRKDVDNQARSRVTHKEKKIKSFSISFLGIRGLIKNIDQLKVYHHNCQFNIICLNETMLD